MVPWAVQWLSFAILHSRFIEEKGLSLFYPVFAATESFRTTAFRPNCPALQCRNLCRVLRPILKSGLRLFLCNLLSIDFYVLLETIQMLLGKSIAIALSYSEWHFESMSEVQAVHWIICIKESFIIAYWSVVKFNFLFRRSKQGYTLLFSCARCLFSKYANAL